MPSNAVFCTEWGSWSLSLSLIINTGRSYDSGFVCRVVSHQCDCCPALLVPASNLWWDLVAFSYKCCKCTFSTRSQFRNICKHAFPTILVGQISCGSQKGMQIYLSSDRQIKSDKKICHKLTYWQVNVISMFLKSRCPPVWHSYQEIFCKLPQIPVSVSVLLHISRTWNWAQCCVNRGVQTALQVSRAEDNYPFPGEHPPLTWQAVIRSLWVQPQGVACCLSARYLQY